MEARDGVLEAVALDEPHGVERPAVVVGAQAVDRDDPGVLQPAGDLGLEQEPATRLVAGRRPVGPDLLEGHLAVQLLVAGDVDAAQAALARGAGGCGTARRRRRGAGRVGMRRRGVGVRPPRGPDRRGRGWPAVGVGEPLQVVADRAERAEGGQALLGVAAVDA